MDDLSLSKLTIRDVPLEGKTVLVRVDYNIPLTDDGKLSNDSKIKASLPTLHYLLECNCKVVVVSHLGRATDGHHNNNLQYSLEPIAARLAVLLKRDIRFVDQAVGYKTYHAIKRSPKIGVVVLENLNFYDGEEKNDPEFAKRLAKDTGADYFVQDGFDVLHRKYASTCAITDYVPGVAGLSVEKNCKAITKLINRNNLPGLEGLLDAKT